MIHPGYACTSLLGPTSDKIYTSLDMVSCRRTQSLRAKLSKPESLSLVPHRRLSMVLVIRLRPALSVYLITSPSVRSRFYSL